MIDLHCHVLPGLDDGPGLMEDSLELARAASAQGTETLVATPHIREDHPFPRELIDERARQLNAALRDAGIDLQVVTGGEVAITQAAELDDAALRSVCLAEGPYMLVESPYVQATELLETTLFDLQVRGFRPVLAHPERSPAFMSDIDRLATLVDRGILCSVTAGSMEGTFGRTVRGVTLELFKSGLVHDVASDSHQAGGSRGPALRPGFESLDKDLPGVLEQIDWFTRDAPAAMLAGQALPPPPQRLRARGKRWLRALR